MKSLLLYVFVLVAVMPYASARVVELEDREGRRIEVDVISLQNGILTFRRTDSVAVFRYPIEQLSAQSIKELHEAMTEGLTPTLKVQTISNNRKSTTHWKNVWGEYSRTTVVERTFGIEVSSTSGFRKEVDVFVYWFADGELKYFTQQGFAGGDEKVEIVTSESASQWDRRYDYYYSRERYSVGDATVELVVLVKDMKGNVLTSWSTSRSVEEIARKRNDKSRPVNSSGATRRVQ